MKAVEELVKGKEIDIEELGGRADEAQIKKVSFSSSCVLYTSSVVRFPIIKRSCLVNDDQFFVAFQHYKISGPELGISSLADAITCRIAARDAL